jgi:hypothetical protein
MAGELEVKKESVVSLVESRDFGEIIQPLIREIHLFDSYIAGTTCLKDKSVLELIQVGDLLTLQRENNQFDANAILILYEGRKLGYVPEKDNLIFARLMDAGKMLKAKINNIQNRDDYFKQINIEIYLMDI